MHGDPARPSQLYGQIRIGRVSSVDSASHRAEVTFDEIDGLVIGDLRVLRGFAGDYCLPAKDTPVLCLLVEGRLGVGYVLGAIYTDSDVAPLNDAGQRAVVGDDLRLGAADATDKAASSPKVKSELDKIKDELKKISTTLISLTGGASAPAAFGTAYTVGYSPTAPDAEKVKLK